MRARVSELIMGDHRRRFGSAGCERIVQRMRQRTAAGSVPSALAMPCCMRIPPCWHVGRGNPCASALSPTTSSAPAKSTAPLRGTGVTESKNALPMMSHYTTETCNCSQRHCLSGTDPRSSSNRTELKSRFPA